MLSPQNFLSSANMVIDLNRLFAIRYFSQSWSFDYLRPIILYLYVKTEIDFRDGRVKTRYGNNRFITAYVRNFLAGKHYRQITLKTNLQFYQNTLTIIFC